MRAGPRRAKAVKQFMRECRYSTETGPHGIKRTSGKGSHLWDYEAPDKVLSGFMRWLEQQDPSISTDFKTPEEWVDGYRLDVSFADGVEANPRAMLSAREALAVWQLKGRVPCRDLMGPFGVTREAINNVWQRQSWAKLISAYETKYGMG